MQYRKLGKTGIKASILGFGCMRLPTKSWDTHEVDEKEAIRIIRKGIDAGINYVDTSEGYHEGESEPILGKALLDGYREKVTLVTKNSIWRDDFTKPEDFERYLELNLKNLQTDTIDIYLLHGINEDTWRKKVLPFKLIDRAKKAKAEGKIKHIGFSFHDKVELLKEIIDTDEFEIMMVQYNLLDKVNEEMIEYAAKKGLGIAIMGPVGGGRLAGRPPKEMEDLLTEGRDNFADLALKFVWSNPHVTVALSGMGSEAMVDDNLALAKNDTITLTEEEIAKTEKIIKQFKELTDNICTDCKYCMPCPNEVNIPFIFRSMIFSQVYGQHERGKNYYSKIGEKDWPPGQRVEACTECGECLSKCPQKIPIIEQLKKAHKILTE